MSAKDLGDRADTIAQAVQDEANALAAEGRLREAKVALASAQRDLRDVKRDASNEQRAIRNAATDRRQQISGSGQMIGMVAGSKARGAMARSRAGAKRRLASQQQAALRPYEVVKEAIDRYVANIDRASAQITDEMAARRSGHTDAADEAPDTHAVTRSAAPIPAPLHPTAPPQWLADPAARNQFRWWDGSRWTESVANGGIASTDPV